jgi:hypothetical protein
VIPVTMSRGNSKTAQYLDITSQAKGQYFQQSAIFGAYAAYNDLIAVWAECKTANWDGYDAFPVQEQTFLNTYFFIQALPLGVSLPSVGVEPDGHITLEWYRHPRWTLSISISPESKLYYAALFGESVERGSEVFLGKVPGTILDLIQRVCIARSSIRKMFLPLQIMNY